jgi:hypothetical protein
VAREFVSFGAFADYLVGLLASLPAAERRGLTAWAEIVQRESQREIGHYQDAAGPFAAWPALTENTLEGFAIGGRWIAGKVEMGYAPPDNPLLREGTLRDHIEYSVGEKEAAVGVPSVTVTSHYDDRPRDIGDIAIWHELGTATEPPRSFLGGAAFRMRDRAVDALTAHQIEWLAGFPASNRRHEDPLPNF